MPIAASKHQRSLMPRPASCIIEANIDTLGARAMSMRYRGIVNRRGISAHFGAWRRDANRHLAR